MVDGLFNCIHCSLRYLLENTDKEAATMIPLLEVKLELQVWKEIINSTQGSPIFFENDSHCLEL